MIVIIFETLEVNTVTERTGGSKQEAFEFVSVIFYEQLRPPDPLLEIKTLIKVMPFFIFKMFLNHPSIVFCSCANYFSQNFQHLLLIFNMHVKI